MANHWKPEEDQILRDIYPNSSKKTIMEKLPKDWKSICLRARKLDLHRDITLINEDRKLRYGPRKDSFKEDELNLLKEIFQNNTKAFIINKFQEAGFNRSW